MRPGRDLPLIVSAGIVLGLLTAGLTPGAVAVDVDPLAPAGERSAEQQRQESSPTLVPRPAEAPRSVRPTDRYAPAGGCYTLGTSDGRWIARDGDRYTTVDERDVATPFHFQATELGVFLLFDDAEDFVARDGGVVAADEPSPAAEWVVDVVDGSFTAGEGEDALALAGDAVTTGPAEPLTLELVDGCATWDEVEVNVEGPVLAGTSPLQEVRGYLDDHIHHMTQDFLGGNIHCGRPWHPYGVTYALVDCDDHLTTEGQLAIPEIVLSGNPTHDPVGWPTFVDWPAWNSLTHEGTYYKWVERAWRGGQRLWVNLLVENTVLCSVYPGPNTTCTDMDSIRTQAQQTRDFENYVDAQNGGPGKGWYRVVETPAEARAVINDGKLAVVLGTESSELFGCRIVLDSPACDEAAVTAGLDELHALGVRQMVPTHKFDNAFSGVKGDEGFNGVVTNLGNALQSGSFLDMEPCPDGLGPDNPQLNPGDLPEPTLARALGEIFGVVSGTNPLPTALPVYGPAPHCNTRGMTDMGRFMLDEMVRRNIIYDVDHMSARGRSDALDVFESIGYSGVISSHSWSDPAAIPRIFALGGMVNSYAGDSTGFVEEWHGHTHDMDGRYYFGMGYGADTNGLGAQGAPRGPDAEDPVTYPFDGRFGVEIDQQRSGERLYDVNVDGVAHYGLYPDWIEDLRMLAGDAIDDDLVRGPESYLLMWERANGIENDACRQPELRRQVDDFEQIATGTSSEAVLVGYGQPHLRRDLTYRYCALDGDRDAAVTVTFTGDVVSTVDVTRGDESGEDPDDGGPVGPPTPPDGVEVAPVVGSGPEASGGGEVVLDVATDLPSAGGANLTPLLAGLVAFVVGAYLTLVRRRRPS